MPNVTSYLRRLAVLALIGLVAGCATTAPTSKESASSTATSQEYRIGPGDKLNVFVWRNPEISVSVPVRPDGKISTPLVEDMVAAGKTPRQLARDIEGVLSTYIRSPVVTVIVTEFVGAFGEQIRVVGQAATPQSLPYRDNITLLDVMIEVGGLNEFAAGNRAKVIRPTAQGHVEIPARLDDLLNNGDVSANIKMQPGDVVIIPESWF